jgi:succinate dehydrogenase / fumarate reductase cytochrome b subunit
MAEAVVAPARAAAMSRDEMHWTLRRLHSISGIVPIGFFLFFHLFENSYVVRGGAQMWWKESEFTRNIPFQVFVEAGLLWIPILYHALYGLVITATSAPNLTSYGYTRNYQYTLQRITGIIAFAFILFHVSSTRGYFYATGVETNYERMHYFMTNGLILTAYLIGTLSCVYHLTNGIFTFSITWGIAQGPQAQRLVNYACTAIFIVLAIVSVQILISFRVPA